MLLLAAFAAFAQEKEEPKFPVVKPSGVLFARYGYDLTDGADGYNAFSIDRVYLRADVAMSKAFGARVTLDADRMKPFELGTEEVTYDTKYRVFVKHAYLEAKDLGPLKLRAGMVANTYTSFYDDTWGDRYITEAFSKNAGVHETADLGVQLVGNHGDGLVGWDVSLVNGEGYSKLELDAGKKVQARVTVDPLAKLEDRELPITGFASYAGHPTTGVPSFIWGGAAGFQMPRLFVWAEVLGTQEGPTSGFGYSATLSPRLPKYLGIVSRYDHWDPDTSAQGDEENLLVAGLERDFMKKVSVAVTYERSWLDVAPDAPEHGVVVHAQAGF